MRYKTFSFVVFLIHILFASPFIGSFGRVLAQDQSLATINLPQKALSGNTLTGTIELSAGAPQGGLLVTLRSDDPGVAKVEPQIKQLREGERSLTFSVQAGEPKDTQIRVDVGGRQLGSKLRVHNLLTVIPSEIAGGRTAVGKIELPDKAPSAGVIFTLTIDPALATLEPPQQVIVKPEKDEATFKIFTKPVPGNTPLKITAEGGGFSQTVELRLKYDRRRLIAAIIAGLITTAFAFIIVPSVWNWRKWLGFIFRRGISSTKAVYDGEDGLPSTSIFQNYLWTAAVIFAYSSMAFIKLWWLGGTNNLTISSNIIIVMGASIATRVLARAITAKRVQEGKVLKMSPISVKKYLGSRGENGLARFKYIFTDDAGNPDLNKIQVMAWTFIAFGIFLIDWHSNVMLKSAVDMDLPTIDGALVVLMGLSVGGYVGNKLIKVERPVLINADPPNPKKGTGFRINGQGFTTKRGVVLVDGQTASDWVIKDWQDTFVTVEVPANAKGTHSIGVIANNQPSSNAVDVEVTE